jgi:hypothetical protein
MGVFMIKKIIILFLLLISLLTLAACDGTNPYIQVQNNNWTYSSYNREIQIDKGYEMDQSHSYDIIETENGIDVIIHYNYIGEDESG